MLSVCTCLALGLAKTARPAEPEWDSKDSGFLAELEFLQDTGEVEVASRHRQSVLWSPSAVTIFTRKDILSSGANSLVDLLRRVPGFNVFRVKSSYSLLGTRALTDMNNNQVLLLVDGREELIELTGFALWNALSIDLYEIERIEVIRGPGSALYGANAFAAVVSITTISDPLPHETGVSLGGGELGNTRLFARYRDRLEVGGGQLSFGVGAGCEKSLSPSVIREELQALVRTHAFLRYRRENQLDLSLQGGAVSGDSLVYLFAGDARLRDLFLPWLLVKADLESGRDTTLRARFFYNRYNLDVDFRSGLNSMGVWMADIPVIGWDSHTLDGEVQVEHSFGETLLLVGGANLRYSLLGGRHLIPESDHEWRAAGYLHLEWRPWEAFQLSGGLRLDSKNFSETTVSPRLAAVWRPWPGHAFRLGYGLAFRKPSYVESRLHLEVVDYNLAVREIVDLLAKQVGNDDLRSTKVHSLEAGWQARLFGQRLRLGLNLFANFYNDIITLDSYFPERPDFPGVPDVANSMLRFINSRCEVTSLGGEAEAAFEFGGNWSVWGNLALRWLDSTFGDYHITAEPRFRTALGGRYLPYQGPRADLEIYYLGSYQSWWLLPRRSLWHNRVELGENWLLFGRLGYRFRLGSLSYLETGFLIHAPLGGPHREFGGISQDVFGGAHVDGQSNFGGEYLARVVSLYLNGTF